MQNTQEIGKIIKQLRTSHQVTQQQLALAAGTGIRFIVDLEKGKATCHVGKVIKVINCLGAKISIEPK